MVVAAMAPRYRKLRPPKAVRASCETTVSISEGMAPIGLARQLMPRNITPRMEAIQIRVTPALRLRGSLGA